MRIIGDDAAEFALLNTNFPIILNNNQYDTVQTSVLFNPQKIGSKDAQMLIYWNNIYQYGLVKFWAEGIQGTDNTISVARLDEIPTHYSLSQNYPNPFNPSTKIEYALPEDSHVRLSIHNSMGQEVLQLTNGTQPAGKYIVDFNARNLPSGVYFYRLQTGNFITTKKMMLVK
jgi:hypothetical protein